MSLNIKLTILAVFFVFLSTSNAFAGIHEHEGHQHHQNSIASPFDGKKEVRSLHCLLRRHTGQTICPHSSDKGQRAIIASECGGKTSGNNSATASFSSDFAESHFFLFDHNSPDENLTPVIILGYHRFPDSLDPPPSV